MTYKNNWYFPYGKDIEPESVNNAKIEIFKDNILNSLAREICQNSLDASSSDFKPVKVLFEKKSVDISEIPDVESFNNEIIPLSRKTWIDDQNAQNFLDTYEKLLKNKDIKVLRISDYNTTGLEGEHWKSLIEKAGTSVKSDITSAGSFGIGKAAPFASSDLRMVFYSTMIKNGEEKSIGVTKFISYDREDGMTAQGVGYLGCKGKEPILEQKSFGFDKRKECGTDIYIIGFNQANSWNEEIISSLLENFMISIYDEKLIAIVEGIEISRDTMGDLIMNLDERKYKELKNYYSILENPEHVKIELDDRFEKYGFSKGDGYLLLAKSEEANRSVLMTRKAGMKIYDRKRISGSIQFNGIFQATGERFNTILKKMENPSHNDWIPSRYQMNVKLGEDLLKDIYNFCKENVVQNFQEKVEEQVDAFGISDFLPNKMNEKNNIEDEGLKDSVKNIVLKKRNIKNIKSRDMTEKELEKKLERDGIIEGDGSGSGSSQKPGTTNSGGTNTGGIGEGNGNNQQNTAGNMTTINRKRSFKETDKYTARLMEMNYKEGEYRLFIRGRSNTDKLKIELDLVGENGYGYKDAILSGNSDGKDLFIVENSIIIESPKKGSNIIDLKLAFKNRVKMVVKLYENR